MKLNLKTFAFEEQNLLNNFYVKLENIEECTSLLQPDNFDWNKASDELRFKLSVEVNSLTKLHPDHIQQIFGDSKEYVKEYIHDRIQNTHNYLLKAKYNQFLYCLTKNNQYCKQAIDEYQKTFELHFNNSNQEDASLNFQDVFDIILHLTKLINYKKVEFKIQIHNYLKDQQIYIRIKTYIISSILKSDFFKNSITELNYIPALCCDLAKNETKHRFIEINLQSGLDIAIKLQNSEMQKNINELLGDNEYKNIKPYDGKLESIMIPHQNRQVYKKIIQYYKNAHDEQKCSKAFLEYNENKANCKFLKFSSQVENSDEKQKVHKELFFSIVHSSTKNIVFQLAFGSKFIFISDEYLKKHVAENQNNFLNEFFKIKQIDINNNEKNTEKDEHLKFQLYSINLSQAMLFYYNVIIESFIVKKLSYKKVARELSSNLFFGQKLTLTRNDQNLSYTWFLMIDIGLKSFFEQINLILKNKQPDWRFSIDFLSLKFEGILRDIVDLLSGDISKLDRYGNTTNMLLEDLLRSDSLDKIFNKDDINLFQYTFTSKGYNIRNNIAHSFYKPQDYTWYKAILVLLCVLRLAKYNYVNSKESI